MARRVVRERIRASEDLALSEANSRNPVDVEDLADPEAEPIDDVVIARLSSPRHRELVLNRIRQLPARQAHAVLLAWLEGRRIEGPGPDTVAHLMDISPRAVHKLLEKAPGIGVAG